MSRAEGSCPREGEVVRAVLADDWPVPLRDHARACADCREVAAVGTWLTGVRRLEEAGRATLPAPGRIWWRAEVERRVERRRSLVHRALRPVRIVERAAAAVTAGATAWVLWTAGPSWPGTLLLDAADSASLPPLLSLVLTVSAAGAVATALLVARLRAI